jgi:tetratricopeptide (TPR) repeat protein
MSASPRIAPKRAVPASAALPLLAAALVFGQVLGHGILDWDDRQHLAAVPGSSGGGIDPWAALWQRPEQGLYVPVSYTFFAAEIHLAKLLDAAFPSGGSPAFSEACAWQATVMHAGSVLLHGGCIVLVYLLLRRLVENDWAASAGACLFAVHPLQVESVAWISETRGLLAAFFSLAAMILYLRSADRRRGRAEGSRPRRPWQSGFDYAAATALFLAALLSKPSAAAVPAMLAAIETLLGGRSVRQTALRLAPWLAAALAVGIWTAWLQSPGTPPDSPGAAARAIVAGDAVACYVQKLFCPWPLLADYGRTPAVALESVWFLLGWALAGGVAALWFSRAQGARRRWLAGPMLFVAALLPVLGFVPFAFQRISTVADRYAYLAMLGPALLLAFGLARFGSRVGMVTAAVAICVLANLGLVQASRWRDDATLWAHTLHYRPESLVANHNRGHLLAQRGEHAEAVGCYRRVLRFDPGHVPARLNLAVALFALGRSEEAEAELHEALRRRPEWAAVHYNLGGLILFEGDDLPGAAAHFRNALDREGDSARAWVNLGVVRLKMGRLERAIECFRRAIALRPRLLPAWVNLAAARAAHDGDEAAAWTCREGLGQVPPGSHAAEVLRRLAGEYGGSARRSEKPADRKDR